MKFKRSNIPFTTETKIADFEKKAGFKLPHDYKQFLLDHNGGVPENTLFDIPDCASAALIGHFLGLERPKESISFWMNELSDDLPEGFMPIGFDPGGNVILMDITDEGTIYYWDSARHFPQSTDDDNTFWIANSFTDLLKNLKIHP
jgi:cell wall assembly regulator SMI1